MGGDFASQTLSSVEIAVVGGIGTQPSKDSIYYRTFILDLQSSGESGWRLGIREPWLRVAF